MAQRLIEVEKLFRGYQENQAQTLVHGVSVSLGTSRGKDLGS